MDRVIVTVPFCGICYMQVCAAADASDEEVLEVCNRENPSGTTLGWCAVDRSTSKMGPVTCSDDTNRLHLMVSC